MKKFLSILTVLLTSSAAASPTSQPPVARASFNNSQSYEFQDQCTTEFATTVYIKSTDDLRDFSQNFNTGKIPLTCNVFLEKNVTFSGDVMPIGTIDYPFAGTFDGGFNTVIFDVNSPNTSCALFGHTNGATIKNIFTSGNICALQATGIVLCANQTRISTCVNNAQVTSLAFAAGGIAVYARDSMLFTCTNSAQINGTESAAGIVCVTDNTDVSFCENDGALTCAYGFAGGIVSIARAKTSVAECQSTENFFCRNTYTSLRYEATPMTKFLPDIEAAISSYNLGMPYTTRNFVIAQKIVGLAAGDDVTIAQPNKVIFCMGIYNNE